MSDPDVLVARIGKPHGIKGEVTVQAHTDDPEGRFVAGVTFSTQALAGSGVPKSLTIASARLHNGIWLLSFAGIPDRTGAEGLRGTKLVGAPEQEAEEEDAWYEDDLKGFAVCLLDGEQVGVLDSMVTGGAQDRLVVALSAGGRAEIPFVHELVPEIDEQARRIVIDPPAGLLDLEAL